MENNQRFFVFILLSMAVFIGWINFGPKWFPGMFPKPKPKAEAEKTAEEKSPAAKTNVAKTDDPKGTPDKVAGKTVVTPDGPAVATRPKSTFAKEPDQVVAKPEPKKPEAKPAAKPPANVPKTVKLGSLDPVSGYFIEVELTSRGASVTSIQLNDKRYRTLKDRDVPLKVVGNTTDKLRTFGTAIPLFDDNFKGDDFLNRTHWAAGKPVLEDGVAREVTFSYELPDRSFKVLKRYWLEPVDFSEVTLETAQNNRATGYQLKMAITIENHTVQNADVSYRLQGPVGLPLENIQNARVFRGAVVGLVEEGGKIKASSLTASELVDAKKERWELPIRYVGLDTQYFTALIAPVGDDRSLKPVKVAEAYVVDEAAKAEHSDISLFLQSKTFEVPAGDKVTHEYVMYAGPKRKALLETYEAADVIKFGFFGFFAKMMLALMGLFHDYMAIPWGIAIVCLTIVVRGAMFPLSKKQAKSGRLMKELQPKIAELKKKYGKDREKMARAQMELFSKHGYNPFAGCLPVLLQLPIFIGLYTALSTSIDLRLAPFPFTWIDNLAAPDALFRLPFALPFLGADFNLLPIITCVLFLVQQKMFMPPPAPDDEQAQMTHKMMKFMPIIMGFLFYRVPSGLCVYFIASSAWGIGERKLLDMNSDPIATGSGSDEEEGKTAKSPSAKPDADSGDANGKSGGGFFGKLLAMADQAADGRATGNGESKSEPQLAGGLSRPVTALRDDLLDLLGDLEAGLDFVEEDIEFVSRHDITRRLESAESLVAALLAKAVGRSRSAGCRVVVLAGMPNAGKSTLFNALCDRDAAIVSQREGTTRDFLTVEIDWDGLAIELVDTAGWESTGSGIGFEAQKTRGDVWNRADLTLWCSAADATDDERRQDDQLCAQAEAEGRPLLRIETKSDMRQGEPESSLPRICAQTGEGLGQLRQTAVQLLSARSDEDDRFLGSTAARTRGSLEEAQAALQSARAASESGIGEELRFEQGALAVHHSDVRAEKLVRRAGEKIAVECFDLDQPMGRVMHGVDKDLCSHIVGGFDKPGNGIDRPGHVRGIPQRDEAGFLTQQRMETVDVESTVFEMNADPFDDRPRIAGGEHPRADIGVVIEIGDKNLVAGRPGAADRPAECKRQAGHVAAEADAAGVGRAEKIGQRLVSAVENHVAFFRGGEPASVVGVGVQQIPADRIGDALRNLTARGTVKEGDRRIACGTC
eukprot:g21975.t1